MKLYKNQNGKIFAFEEDGSQDGLITSDMVPATQADVEAAKAITPTWDTVRIQRDALLAEADYLVNTALDNGQDATALRSYRQALRDVPQNNTDPANISWPTKP